MVSITVPRTGSEIEASTAREKQYRARSRKDSRYSGTSSGTYDIFKIWTLCCSRSGRLVVFATLALLSAMGKSTLSNIIAYEAITQLAPAPSSQLRLLAGPIMNNTNGNAQGFEPYKSDTWLASYEQRRVYTQDTTSVVQQVSWENSTKRLDSGAYIALNVTTSDVSNPNSSVMTLYNVPAVRATAQCTPHNLTSASIWEYNKGVGFQMLFDRYNDTNETSQNSNWYIASVPATITVLIDGDTRSSPYRSLDFLAYNFDGTSMLIGTMGGNLGGDPAWTEPNLIPIQSPFGELPAQNFSIYPDNNATSPTSVLFRSLECTINQQNGLVNMSRKPTSNERHRSDTSWSNATHVYASILAGLYDSLGIMSFVSAKSGLAYALTPSAQVQACNTSDALTTTPSWCTEPGARKFDFQTMADKLLYSEMEIQRVSYEVAARNQTLATPDTYASVTTFGNILKYRITYIPALVFAGMVCVFFAAVATVALMIHSRRSIASRTSRQVDSVRLLVDYAINNHDAQLTAVARSWNEDELQDCAARHIVRYERHHDQNGKPSTVVLRSIDRYEDKVEE